MFVIQNKGISALGSYGVYLGYGSQSNPIGKSIGIKFDLYDNAGEGNNSTGLYIDGATPSNLNSTNLNFSGIDLHSGRPLNVEMAYVGNTLTVTIRDNQTGASATQIYGNIDIPAIVGANTAFVGFTGGDGGLTSLQAIYDWNFFTTQP